MEICPSEYKGSTFNSDMARDAHWKGFNLIGKWSNLWCCKGKYAMSIINVFIK